MAPKVRRGAVKPVLGGKIEARFHTNAPLRTIYDDPFLSLRRQAMESSRQGGSSGAPNGDETEATDSGQAGHSSTPVVEDEGLGSGVGEGAGQGDDGRGDVSKEQETAKVNNTKVSVLSTDRVVNVFDVFPYQSETVGFHERVQGRESAARLGWHSASRARAAS